MLQLAQLGVLPPQAVSKFMEAYLETYEFGPAGDIVQMTEKFQSEGGMTESQTEAMKVAIAEVLKDFISAGILAGGKQEESQEKPPAEAISYKDLPPSGKVQMAEAAGIKLDPNEVVDKEQMDIEMKAQEMQLKQREHAMKMAQAEEMMEMKERMADRQMALKVMQQQSQERRMNSASKRKGGK